MLGDLVEVLDLSYDGEKLVGQRERVVAGYGSDRLLLHWNAAGPSAGFLTVGNGVALVRSTMKDRQLEKEGPDRVEPTVHGASEYGWMDTAHNGVFHLVLILPPGKVVRDLADCKPPP